MSRNKVEITGINTSTLKTIKTDEMNKLFILYKKGDKSAKNSLIEYNLKLVLSILKKYYNKTDNLDDLFQIGTIGLIKAINNFDLNYDVKFSTYAVFIIEGEIKRYLRDNNQIRISRSIKELSYKIISYKEKYLKEEGTYPSNDDIMKHFNITSYDLYTALNSLTEPMSIFEPIFNDGGDTIYLLDQLEDKSQNNLNELIFLRDALTKLKDKERMILERRYYDGMSQSEIADDLNISQAQVSRIESKALNNVRKLIL